MDPISAAFTALTAAATPAAAAATTAAVAAPTIAAPVAGAVVANGVADAAAATVLPAFTETASLAAEGAASTSAAATAGAAGLNFARMFNIGSTIFNTAGNFLGGLAQKREKDFEAKQLDVNAKERIGAATREMQIEGRNTDLAISKARNNAAAGGGALDPSVVNILGDLEKQGARNEANTLDTANSAAHEMETQAVADRFSGQQSMIGGTIGAVSSLFSGLNKTMAAKYGADTSSYPMASYG